MKDMLNKYLSPEMALYDVGCGKKPFAEFLRGRVSRHIGVDIDHGFYGNEFIDLVGSADNLPVEDGVADAILSSQVIEHLPDPLKSFSESYRALRPGGYLFLSYPFLYPIHAAPYDFMRFTRFATEKALQNAGFQLVEIKTLGGFWYLLGVMGTIYLQGIAPLQKLRLFGPVSLLARTIFSFMHRLEAKVLGMMKKDVVAARAAWAVTYVLVAQKPLPA
ncbi:MAG: methyltransferase domain-containing protein [Gallionella sp.]|nr:methyltransferase domain-containing protein [Gallionella sp.]